MELKNDDKLQIYSHSNGLVMFLDLTWGKTGSIFWYSYHWPWMLVVILKGRNPKLASLLWLEDSHVDLSRSAAWETHELSVPTGLHLDGELNQIRITSLLSSLAYGALSSFFPSSSLFANKTRLSFPSLPFIGQLATFSPHPWAYRALPASIVFSDDRFLASLLSCSSHPLSSEASSGESDPLCSRFAIFIPSFIWTLL